MLRIAFDMNTSNFLIHILILKLFICFFECFDQSEYFDKIYTMTFEDIKSDNVILFNDILIYSFYSDSN